MVRPAKPVAARRRPATRPFDTIAVITAAILVAALAVGGNQWFLQVTEPDAKTSVMPKAGAKARTVGEITPIVNSPSAPSAAPQIPALRQSSSMKNGPMLLAFLAYNEASENYKQGRKLEAVEQCEIIIDALGRITPSPLLNIYDNAGGTMLRFAMELRARLNEDLGRGIEQGSKDLLEILSHAPGNRAIKTAYAQHQLHAGGDTALAMELVGGVADEDPHLKQSPTDTRDSSFTVLRCMQLGFVLLPRTTYWPRRGSSSWVPGLPEIYNGPAQAETRRSYPICCSSARS